MQDLETRYFERVAAAQAKFNDALDAARTEHDTEVLAAREELNEKASHRFSVLLGRSPQPAPSEAVKGMLEGMIADVIERKFSQESEKRAIAPPSDQQAQLSGETDA